MGGAAPVDLAHSDFGGRGGPILILHGLFGSSRNWRTLGGHLSRYGRVYGLDLRNHGQSPHTDTHTLSDLTADLNAWITRNLTENPVLMGHSMGGAVGMAYALAHADSVAGLIVIDIAPRRYFTDHSREIRALRLDLAGAGSRDEIDSRMRPLIPDADVRRFLQTNAERTDHGFRWRVNTDALAASPVLEDLGALEGRYGGRTLFVAGGASDYITEADLPRIRSLFPAARVRTVDGAGHWLHHTATSALEEILGEFLTTGESA